MRQQGVEEAAGPLEEAHSLTPGHRASPRAGEHVEGLFGAAQGAVRPACPERVTRAAQVLAQRRDPRAALCEGPGGSITRRAGRLQITQSSRDGGGRRERLAALRGSGREIQCVVDEVLRVLRSAETKQTACLLERRAKPDGVVPARERRQDGEATPHLAGQPARGRGLQRIPCGEPASTLAARQVGELSEGRGVDSGGPADRFGDDRKNRQAQNVSLLGVGEDSVNREAAFMGGFEQARMWFPSSIEFASKEGLTHTWLLRTSKQSWTRSASDGLAPDITRYEYGHPLPDEADMQPHVVAALVQGTFPSYFADRPLPAAEADDDEAANGSDGADGPTGTPSPVKKAASRIVVFANDDWLDTREYGISYQIGAPYGAFAWNMKVLQDAIDWLMEDDDLITIRNRGRTYRPLERLDEDDQALYMYWSFALPILVTAALGIALLLVRTNRRPLV